MATYAESAKKRELRAKRMVQDQHMAGLHHSFDQEVASRTDKRGGYKTMKYERPSFAVVTASDAFREGYDQICWTTIKKENEDGREPERKPSTV